MKALMSLAWRKWFKRQWMDQCKPEAFQETGRNELGSPGLIDFSSCNLRIVYGASGSNLKKLLKACFQLLKDIPARRDDFISATE